MAVQPILNQTIGAFDEMKMYAVMNDAHYEAGTSEVNDAHIHSCYEIYVNFSGDVSFFHDSTVYSIQPYDVNGSAKPIPNTFRSGKIKTASSTKRNTVHLLRRSVLPVR